MDSQTDYYNNVNGSLIHILSTATNFNTQNNCPKSICAGGAAWIAASSTTTTLSDVSPTTTTWTEYEVTAYNSISSASAAMIRCSFHAMLTTGQTEPTKDFETVATIEQPPVAQIAHANFTAHVEKRCRGL